MEQSDQVTILIPCSNATYLEECLNSIEVNNHTNFRTILVLNGSALSERQKIEKYFVERYTNLTVLCSEEHGIVNALNLGLSSVQDEYVARLDADDLIPPNRLSEQVNALKKEPELMAVGGQMELIGYQGDVLPKPPGYPTTTQSTEDYMSRYCAMPHPGVTFRRSAVKRVGGYRETFPFLEDWDLWVRLMRLGTLRNLNSVSVIHRVHELQSTRQNEVQLLMSWKQFHHFRIKDAWSENLITNSNGSSLEIVPAIRRHSRHRKILIAISGLMNFYAVNNDFWYRSHSYFNRKLAYFFFKSIAVILNPNMFKVWLLKSRCSG